MKELIITIAVTDKESLGPVRCIPGLLAAEYEGLIWLRGIPANGPADIRLRQLPGIHSYMADEQGLLFPPGKPTPVRRLPDTTWLPLPGFIPVTLPVSGLPGVPVQQYMAGLAPCALEEESNALLTSLTYWKTYAETAPEVRLAQTRFAVNADGDVLVLGSPLPPVPGKALVLRGTMLFPAGYHFDPPAIAPLAETALNADKNALLLFDIDGSWQRIEEAAFVQTTRSAVRMTTNPQV